MSGAQGAVVPLSYRMSVISNSVFLAVLLVLAHGLLKWVAAHPADSYLALLIAHWPVVFVSIGLYGFVFFYYAHLLKRLDISQLYPAYTGLSIVFLLLMGVVVFGEKVTLIQTAGCTMIIGGTFLVSK